MHLLKYLASKVPYILLYKDLKLCQPFNININKFHDLKSFKNYVRRLFLSTIYYIDSKYYSFTNTVFLFILFFYSIYN